MLFSVGAGGAQFKVMHVNREGTASLAPWAVDGLRRH